MEADTNDNLPFLDVQSLLYKGSPFSMGCDASRCLRFLIVLINILLMLLFLLLMVFGFLIRFSPHLVTGYMQALLDKSVPETTAENIAKFFMQNCLPIALALILFGLLCALFCLVGAMASCCGCRMLLKIYAGILAVLIIAQSVAVGLIFGTNENLQNTVDALMTRTLKGAFVKDHADTPGVYVWYQIMTAKNVTCCGMDGYSDFKADSIPSPCCSKSTATMPSKCSEADAKKEAIPGCRTRINEFVEKEKTILLVIPIIFILIQVILFALTVAALRDFAGALFGKTGFSKIDLVRAFHQIPFASEDIPKTAVATPFGLFEFIRMSFGLRNAAQTFQRFIDHVLRGLPFVYACIDDLLVASRNEEEHKDHLALVFDRLDKFGVVINPSKCVFGVPSLEFLDHQVDSEGLRLLPSKVEAVRNFPPPTSKRQLQQFLGMVNFYRWSLPNCADLMLPLTNMLSGPKGPFKLTSGRN
nr:unnamed protein product [Spirometra erinaceieuropaei]